MPKRLPHDLLERVTAELASSPDGAAIEQLEERLAGDVSRRSLQRKLAEWVRAGAIRAKGDRRGRRYFAIRSSVAPPVVVSPAAGHRHVTGDAAGDRDDSVPVSREGQQVRNLVRRSIVDRPPVGYERAFLDSYEPNVTAYLPESLGRHLHELGRSPDRERPAGTYAREILNRLLIDLSWASSRLEGNTYSLLDTQQLIEEGKVAAGKDAKETQMILNHKAAIELLVDSAQEIAVNRFTVLNRARGISRAKVARHVFCPMPEDQTVRFR